MSNPTAGVIVLPGQPRKSHRSICFDHYPVILQPLESNEKWKCNNTASDKRTEDDEEPGDFTRCITARDLTIAKWAFVTSFRVTYGDVHAKQACHESQWQENSRDSWVGLYDWVHAITDARYFNRYPAKQVIRRQFIEHCNNYLAK